MIYIAGAWNEQGKSAFVRAREKDIALIERSDGTSTSAVSRDNKDYCLEREGKYDADWIRT